MKTERTGAYEGRRDHGFSMMGFHGITPETEVSTHYFWSMSTNILSNGVPDLVFEQTARTFREDQVVLEQQQGRQLDFPNRQTVALLSDAGGNLARRQIAALIETERTSAS